ncbi:MAG: HAD family phosphatase [Bacteroidetes bacterium]|nr:HAD family phosphatase [Bacteroidota bacterium]MBS1633530.1 HAD family phosphatase [Bacteroidota bacterium]
MKQNIFFGINAVIFDFDGTIADTFKLHEDAFLKALSPYPVKFNYGDYLGMSTQDAIALIFSNNKHSLSNDELKQLVSLKRKYANQSYTTALQPLPDALDFIRLLYSEKLLLFIASSGSKMNITAGIDALGIRDYLTDIITSDDVNKAKPDPEIFQVLLDKYRIDPSQALVIEDALSGISASRAAGINVISVNPGLATEKDISPPVRCMTYRMLINEFIENAGKEKNSHRNSHL